MVLITCLATFASAEEPGFRSLFDGKSLTGNGWKAKGEAVLRPNDWTESARSGTIALQLHKGVPMEVQFRIEELNNGKQAGMPAPR